MADPKEFDLRRSSGKNNRRSLEAGCTENGGKIRVTPPKGIEGLVPQYLANIQRGMDEILAGVDSRDCQVARRLGHQFKGSGDGYGFPEIARIGAAIELAAMDANEDEIRSQTLALARYLDRVEVVA